MGWSLREDQMKQKRGRHLVSWFIHLHLYGRGLGGHAEGNRQRDERGNGFMGHRIEIKSSSRRERAEGWQHAMSWGSSLS